MIRIGPFFISWEGGNGYRGTGLRQVSVSLRIGPYSVAQTFSLSRVRERNPKVTWPTGVVWPGELPVDSTGGTTTIAIEGDRWTLVN